MIFDELDLFIIEKILSPKIKTITTWEIAGEYYFLKKKEGKKYEELNKEEKKDFQNLYKKVKYRLEEKYIGGRGFCYKTYNGEGKVEYNIDSDMVGITKNKCSDGMKKGIWIRPSTTNFS